MGVGRVSPPSGSIKTCGFHPALLGCDGSGVQPSSLSHYLFDGIFHTVKLLTQKWFHIFPSSSLWSSLGLITTNYSQEPPSAHKIVDHRTLWFLLDIQARVVWVRHQHSAAVLKAEKKKLCVIQSVTRMKQTDLSTRLSTHPPNMVIAGNALFHSITFSVLHVKVRGNM